MKGYEAGTSSLFQSCLLSGRGASQGELRSHGFFYKLEDEDSGMLGLPISVPGRAGYRHLFENSAAIVFLKNDALHFEELGQLGAQPENAKDDGCRASCVDWYGNSQPLFLRGRIIAPSQTLRDLFASRVHTHALGCGFYCFVSSRHGRMGSARPTSAHFD